MFEELFGNWQNELIYVARMALAGLLGIALGFERMKREKIAGVKTHFVVAIGASLMMIISKYAFADMTDKPDYARIAAQVVSGIGFLGAGIIIYRRESLHGLTTAAGVWFTAGIGMAVGAGLYLTAVGAFALFIVTQAVLHRSKKFAANQFTLISVNFIYSDETVNYLKETFKTNSFHRFKAVEKESGTVTDAVIRTQQSFSAEQLAKILLENKSILSIERINDD